MTVTHAVATVFVLMLMPGSVEAQSNPVHEQALMEKPDVLNVPEKPNNYTLTEANPIVLADAANGTVHIKLPVQPQEGQLVDVLKIDKTRNPCIVSANGKPVDRSVRLIVIKSDAPLQLRFQDGKWRKR